MTMQTVVITIHEGVQALDVAGPVDVFNEANNYIAEEDRYETLLVAVDRNPLRASNKMQIIADRTLDEAQGGFDILLVAGGPTLPEEQPNLLLIEWLLEAPWRASIYGSICTGAFTLGHAGLLDSRQVTTHWQHTHQLAAKFPGVQVQPDAIYVRDGRLVTSAGVTAGIDLALALVAQRHGSDVAVTVAKRLVMVAQRQGRQSQFSPYLTAPEDSASPVAQIQNHVMANVGSRHTLQSLAAEVGMSPRNLSRYFFREAGTTPHEFVQRARIDAARRLLEGSQIPLKTVAYDCGFGTADRMRRVFSERLGVTPAQYRGSFQQPESGMHKRED